MKRSMIVAMLLASAVGVYAQREGAPAAPAQAAGGGLNGTAEQRAQQEAREKAAPQLQVTEEVLPLVVPGHTIGEAVGVAKNSKGHLFVFTRSGGTGSARASTASQLFEFDQTLKFVKQWGQDMYASSFAHTVRVDKYDNVWASDEGANMVIKFNPAGMVSMVLGRKPEAIDFFERFIERGEKLPESERHPAGGVGTFNRPTDVSWDTEDNNYISDGYGNSRVVKTKKDGSWVKAVGTYGSGMNQFNTVHGITVDAKNAVYVADRGNRRIQVYDTDLNFKKSIDSAAAPWSVCVTPGPTQYLFSGDGNGKIYKMNLNGDLLGWAQTSQGHGQTGCLVHELHCESENVIYKGDCSTWTVEKITFKAAGRASSK